MNYKAATYTNLIAFTINTPSFYTPTFRIIIWIHFCCTCAVLSSILWCRVTFSLPKWNEHIKSIIAKQSSKQATNQSINQYSHNTEIQLINPSTGTDSGTFHREVFGEGVFISFNIILCPNYLTPNFLRRMAVFPKSPNTDPCLCTIYHLEPTQKLI